LKLGQYKNEKKKKTTLVTLYLKGCA